MIDETPRLIALVHLHARSRRRPLPDDLPRDEAPWAEAERALLADVAAGDARGTRLTASFTRLAEHCGARAARGRAARLASSHHAFRERWRHALAAAEAAAENLRGAARDGARLGAASALLRLGRFAAAIAACNAVRRNARRRGETALASAAELTRGAALHESGDAASAVAAYESAARGFDDAGAAMHAGRARMNLGNALALLGRWDDARTRFVEAALALPAPLDRARCRYNEAVLLLLEDRVAPAENALRAAADELQAAGDAAGAAVARADLGESLLRAGLAHEAAAELTRSYAHASGRGAAAQAVPPAERARIALLLARAHLARGAADQARGILRRRLAVATPALVAAHTALRAGVAAATGRQAAAERLYVAAAAARSGLRREDRARRLLGAAWCADAAGRSVRAAAHVRHARRVAGPLELQPPRLRHDLAAAAFVLAADGAAPSRARRRLAEALSALDLLRDSLGPDRLRRGLLRGRDAFVAAALRFVTKHDGAAAGLALLERLRARALLDLVSAADARRAAVSAGHENDAELARLRALVRRLELSAESSWDAPALLRAGPRAGRNATDAVRELRAAERELARIAASRAPTEATSLPDPEALARGLPPDTAALVVSTSAERDDTLVFVVHDGEVRVHDDVPGGRETAERLRRLRYLVGRFALGRERSARHGARLEDAVRRALAELSGALLAPLMPLLPRVRRLLVSPDGPWCDAPLAALPVRGRPLAARAPVLLVPSLAAAAAPVSRARGRPLVLSVPDEAVPGIAQEGRRVAAVLPRALLLEGRQANRAALARRAPPRTLHVAAHGRFRADCPAMSGVRLADGWLRVADLRGLPLAGSDVVLSGCETGVGTPRGGEPEGLVRGLFAEGVRSAVLGLWRLDDAATTHLMTAFHRRLAAGKDPGVALAQAQAAAAGRGVPTYYWAGFSAWGRLGG